MKPIVVIGLGNPLMSDEGVGVRILDLLASEADRFLEVDFIDAGTSAMAAVHAMAGRRKAVFVDCALMGEPPGALRRFTPDDVLSRKANPGFSLHEGDVLAAIRLSRRLGECPADVVLFGIEPGRVALGEDLTPALAGRLAEYVKAVRAEIGA